MDVVTQNRKHAQQAFDAEAFRSHFPLLANHPELSYLDNGATTQKPQVVIDALTKYYTNDNANVHRGVYALSERSTAAYETARKKVAQWIGALHENEIIFCRGTTEALNLVAQSYGALHVRAESEVIISHLEHHSNIVPWQMLCERSGATLKVIPMNEAGELDQEAYRAMLNPKVAVVALTHVSNAIGTCNPIAAMIKAAHDVGAAVVIDGAQALAHESIDVAALNCDFYAFSSHKFFGPTGVGVLYGKREHLEVMPPYQGGGDMIRTVTFEQSTYADPPYRFEAGTPNIADTIAFAALLDWLSTFDLQAAQIYEAKLLGQLVQGLKDLGGIKLIGQAAERRGVVSFQVDTIHPHDLGTLLDRENVAIRTGHHCAQPIMDFYGVPATARASLAYYNTPTDLERLFSALRKAKKVFS